MDIRLLSFSKEYLEKSWKWLNDPEIKALTDTPHFTRDQQKKWYKSLNEHSNYKIWGVEVNGKPIGVCGLKNITDIDCEYWGYIGEKEYWGKGIGSELLGRLIITAKNLKLRSIWLKVIKSNKRAIMLYEKFNFYYVKDLDKNLIKMNLDL